MIDKLKKNVLFVVAGMLAYSSYGRAQEPDAGILDLEVADPLPMVAAEKLLTRPSGSELDVDFDPFRLEERLAKQAKSDPMDEYIPEGPAEQADEQGLPVIELESVMRLRGEGIAFFVGMPFREGETILMTENGGPVTIRVINRHRVTVEYLNERHTLDLYEKPRLLLGTKGAKLLGKDLQAGADGGGEGAESQQPIG